MNSASDAFDEHAASDEAVEQAPARYGGVLAILFAAFALFHIYTSFMGPFEPLVQRGLFIGGAMGLAFWSMAAKAEGRAKTAILLVLTACAFYIGLHAMIHNRSFMDIMHDLTSLDKAVAILAILLLLVSTQRILGWALPVLTSIALLYYFWGNLAISGLWQPPRVSQETALSMLYASTSGMFGFMADIGTGVIAIYVIFGALIMATGAGEVFVQLANRVAGRGRGGAGKVTVVTSALFGTVSGSAVANVMAVGSVTIPTMRRAGYAKAFAAGVEASASAGGQILPPIMGAGAFLMAELLNIPYIQVAKTAALPAFLYFVLIFVGVDLYARKHKLPSPALSRPPMQMDKAVPLAGSVLLLIGLLAGNYTPTYAGGVATLALAALTIVCRLGWAYAGSGSGAAVQAWHEACRCLAQGLVSGGKGLIMIAVLLGCAGMLTSILGASGLGVKASGELIAVAGGSLGIALVMTAILCVLLGMDVPTTASYILTASVAAPVLAKFGLPPLTAHLFIFYFAILSAITPPVCASVYAAATIARESFWKVARNAMIVAGGVYFLPFMMVYRPALLLHGSLFDIVYATIMTMAALVCFASATVGYFMAPLRVWMRLVLVCIAGLFFMPTTASDLGACVLLAGFAALMKAWVRRRAAIPEPRAAMPEISKENRNA
ncbi:TRAP transporter permease [Candidimonas nitroreducens]|nr:TRAP transporter fused permease subunit [Candidimonas nitroreducens]